MSPRTCTAGGDSSESVAYALKHCTVPIFHAMSTHAVLAGHSNAHVTSTAVSSPESLSSFHAALSSCHACSLMSQSDQWPVMWTRVCLVHVAVGNDIPIIELMLSAHAMSFSECLTPRLLKAYRFVHASVSSSLQLVSSSR